jgi:hypothetical protein
MTRMMVLTATVSLLALGATGHAAAALPAPTSIAATGAPPEIVAYNSEDAALVLDAGSFAKFKASVDAMTATLPDRDKAELQLAFERLAASAQEPASGGEPGEQPQLPDVRSTIEIVFDSYGQELDGKTFDDIVAMAG